MILKQKKLILFEDDTGAAKIAAPINETSEETNDTFKQLEKIPEKFLNAPSWSEELSDQISKANHMSSIAEKLNFTQGEIQTWLTHSNPTESMFREYFIVNKKLEATAKLLTVFKEMNMQEYVTLIEKYNKKVERLSRRNSYDEESDKPQIFINCESSSLDEANILKKYLEKLDLDVWLNDCKTEEGSRVSSAKVGSRVSSAKGASRVSSATR